MTHHPIRLLSIRPDQVASQLWATPARPAAEPAREKLSQLVDKLCESTRARGAEWFGERADNLTGVLLDLTPPLMCGEQCEEWVEGRPEELCGLPPCDELSPTFRRPPASKQRLPAQSAPESPIVHSGLPAAAGQRAPPLDAHLDIIPAMPAAGETILSPRSIRTPPAARECNPWTSLWRGWKKQVQLDKSMGAIKPPSKPPKSLRASNAKSLRASNAGTTLPRTSWLDRVSNHERVFKPLPAMAQTKGPAMAQTKGLAKGGAKREQQRVSKASRGGWRQWGLLRYWFGTGKERESLRGRAALKKQQPQIPDDKMTRNRTNLRALGSSLPSEKDA